MGHPVTGFLISKSASLRAPCYLSTPREPLISSSPLNKPDLAGLAVPANLGSPGPLTSLLAMRAQTARPDPASAPPRIASSRC